MNNETPPPTPGQERRARLRRQIVDQALRIVSLITGAIGVLVGLGGDFETGVIILLAVIAGAVLDASRHLESLAEGPGDNR